MRTLVEVGAAVLDAAVFAAIGYAVGKWWIVALPTALMLVAWVIAAPGSFSESASSGEGAVTVYGVIGLVASVMGWLLRERVSGRPRGEPNRFG